jgi:hypothetical protein
MGNRFASGKNSIAECDRCGQRYKLTELKKEVQKQRVFNLLVCPQCWDPDHPQLQLGMYPVDDPQAVRNPRHDQTYLVSGPNSAGNPSGGSRDIQWGWNPVGGASQFDAALTPNYLVSVAELGQVTIDTAAIICPVYEITVNTTTAGPITIPNGCFANVYGTAVWTIT